MKEPLIAGPTSNSFANYGRTQNLSVENDGKRFAHVRAGDFTEFLTALGIQPELNNGLAGALIKGRTGIDKPFALQHDELPYPGTLFAARQRQDRGTGVKISRRLLAGQQMECEAGGAAKERLDPSRILNSRQLHEDPVCALSHHRRFGYPRLVDTSPDDFKALVGGTVVASGNIGGRWLETDNAVSLGVDFQTRLGVIAESAGDGRGERERMSSASRALFASVSSTVTAPATTLAGRAAILASRSVESAAGRKRGEAILEHCFTVDFKQQLRAASQVEP